MIVIVVAAGVGIWILCDSLQKEKNKNAELENRIAVEKSSNANKSIIKCLKDDDWVRNNISSSMEANKFIKISDIENSAAYVIDSQLDEKHTIMLVYYDGNKVVVKKKEVPNNYKSISVDTEHNILVLGNLSEYLNEGISENGVSLNTIDKNGFTEYGHSGEVPTLDGKAISYGQFKSRTESIKQEKIELDLNGANLEDYE